jgi:NAD(P)-dependent dehydrogenase (short-subunit alcohol dehydrogenase family)
MSKTWLITGASSGLGRLMTERLLARGDRVVATVRREDSLADLQKEHGVRLVSPYSISRIRPESARCWRVRSVNWAGSTCL